MAVFKMFLASMVLASAVFGAPAREHMHGLRHQHAISAEHDAEALHQARAVNFEQGIFIFLIIQKYLFFNILK